MVQVTHDPAFDDEGIRSSNANCGNNLPDDAKTGSITEEAYRVVTTSMMADQIHQTNPAVALSLLETALTNRNVPLAKHYIENVRELIGKENALKVLHSVGKWVHSTGINHQANFEPSAPPLVENDDERHDNWMKESLNGLRQNALIEIDKAGDHFLKQPQFCELHYQDVLDIVTRDSLQVSGEKAVYCAVMRWAEAECQRRGLPNEDLNIKDVLKRLIYAPRYGLMSKKEFTSRTIEGHRGPDRIGIPSEVNEEIMKYLSMKSKKKRPTQELPYSMSKRRTSNVKSSKSHSSTKEKALINCLSCFTAVFD